MVASPDALKLHLELFQSLGAKFVDLEDWVTRRNNGAPPPKLSVAVTFDDGWRDNYLYAYPILKSFNAPATIFLVSQYINSDRVFWPEKVIAYASMTPELRPAPIANWLREFADGTPFDRRSLSIEEADILINNLKSLDDQSILTHLGNQERPEKGAERQILNVKELHEMRDSGLIRFGAHTRQHLRLNLLADPLLLRDEIALCKRDLDELELGGISLFCYPNGDITNEGEKLVSQTYIGACATQTGLNGPDASPHHLKRFNFHDGNGCSKRLCLSTIGRGIISL